MKPKGYILFIYYKDCYGFDNGVCIGEQYYNSKQDLNLAYDNHFDDKWDVPDRHRIHYFYLDLSNGKFVPMLKYKNGYKSEDGYNQCEKTVLTKRMFENYTW
jgi:hypothetical protein